jgi:acyl-homoserine lactone acylase PvdQ
MCSQLLSHRVLNDLSVTWAILYLQGTISGADMPWVYNPQQGFIVTANNKTIPEDYPHDVGKQFLAGYRAMRCVKPTLQIRI